VAEVVVLTPVEETVGPPDGGEVELDWMDVVLLEGVRGGRDGVSAAVALDTMTDGVAELASTWALEVGAATTVTVTVT